MSNQQNRKPVGRIILDVIFIVLLTMVIVAMAYGFEIGITTATFLILLKPKTKS